MAKPSLTARRSATKIRPDARGVILQSRRVFALSYTHAEDGRNYEHEFARGVTLELHPDGSIRLYRPDGLPLWREF